MQDPVWKLRWVPAGPDRGEALVSISTDGRITQWTIKKGLEYVPTSPYHQCPPLRTILNPKP